MRMSFVDAAQSRRGGGVPLTMRAQMPAAPAPGARESRAPVYRDAAATMQMRRADVFDFDASAAAPPPIRRSSLIFRRR